LNMRPLSIGFDTNVEAQPEKQHYNLGVDYAEGPDCGVASLTYFNDDGSIVKVVNLESSMRNKGWLLTYRNPIGWIFNIRDREQIINRGEINEKVHKPFDIIVSTLGPAEIWKNLIGVYPGGNLYHLKYTDRDNVFLYECLFGRHNIVRQLTKKNENSLWATADRVFVI